MELLRGLDEISGTIVAIGSHDLVLDLAASALRADDPRVTLASSNVGSLGGLVALRDGLCHLAGSHLLDPATGEYTLPYLDRILPGQDVSVVRLVHRDQGLMVAAGNPLGLKGIDDLARPGVRYVNRQRGAGTRVLLDHELRNRGISPDAIDSRSARASRARPQRDRRLGRSGRPRPLQRRLPLRLGPASADPAANRTHAWR